MPGVSGLEVLDRIVEFDSAIEVILMTAHSGTDPTVEAIRKAHLITCKSQCRFYFCGNESQSYAMRYAPGIVKTLSRRRFPARPTSKE
jgi:CheY-like chemotaxis protein